MGAKLKGRKGRKCERKDDGKCEGTEGQEV